MTILHQQLDLCLRQVGVLLPRERQIVYLNDLLGHSLFLETHKVHFDIPSVDRARAVLVEDVLSDDGVECFCIWD